MCQNPTHIKFCTCFAASEEIEEEPKSRTISYEERLEKFQKHFEPRKRPTISPEAYQKSKEALAKGRYLDTEIIWRLLRVDGSTGILGFMTLPNHRVNDKITAEDVLEVINTHEVFDFEYTPEEEDQLTIRERYLCEQIEEHRRPRLMDYISLVFKDYQWEKGWHSIGIKRLELGRGTVEINA